MLVKEDATRLKELQNEVNALKRMNKELLTMQEKQDSLEFAWSGNLGHWFWDFKENQVRFNPLKATALGYAKEELPEYVTFQFFTDRLHPDDYDRVMDAMRDHLSGKSPVWEVKYRIETKNGDYKTYYDRGRVTQREEDGSPLFLSGIVFDISEYETEREELLKENSDWEKQLKKDTMTDLYNRSNILVKLGQAIAEVKSKKSQTISMILIDLDNLYHQNTLFGPLFGDEIILKTGEAINESISEIGYGGVFEGGKFMVVLPNHSKKEATHIAKTIKTTLQEKQFSEPAEVTCSVGVTEFTINDTVSQLFNRADRLLSKAKEQGKNTIIAD